MSRIYKFTSPPSEEVLLAGFKVRPPFAKVRGQTRAKLLRVLHCVLLALGGLGFGYGVSQILTGAPVLLHWATAVGICLVYIAIFSSIFITYPIVVRQIMATRVNQGDVYLTIDENGVQSQAVHYSSHMSWSGFEGVGTSKKAVLLWLGINRVSVPFSAFDRPEQIAAFQADVNKWIEASR